MDYKGARSYILGRLEKELPKDLFFHHAGHTREVIHAVDRLAYAHRLNAKDHTILLTAAAFHDAGYLYQYKDNEPAGARIAGETLPAFDYKPGEIGIVCPIILSTATCPGGGFRFTQSAHSLLEQIMCDGDLDNFGRPDFFEKNTAYRKELEAHSIVFADREWYSGALDMLENHRYYTEVSRRLRDVGKTKNIGRLKDIIKNLV